MLKLRICPHCQETILSPSALFCQQCGGRLPEAKKEEPPALSPETISPAVLPRAGRWWGSFLLGSFVLILIGIVLALLVFLFWVP